MRIFYPWLLLIASSLLSTQVSAQNILRASAPVKISSWTQMTEVGDWITGDPYGCSTWSPKDSEIESGKEFMQKATCSVDDSRTTITFEKNSADGKTKNLASETESVTRAVSLSQKAIGTKIHSCNWSTVDPKSYLAIGRANSSYTHGLLNGKIIWSSSGIRSGYFAGAEYTDLPGGYRSSEYRFYAICINSL